MERSKIIIFFLAFIIKCIYAKVNDSRVFERPEETLLNALTKPLTFDKKISYQCWRDSEIYRKALQSYEPWALQMYDSSVKIPSGVLTGNSKQLGNYDECLKVKNVHGFVGKACSATISFAISSGNNSKKDEKDISDIFNTVALVSGLRNWTSGITPPYQFLWCVPSSCESDAVIHALDNALSPLRRPDRIEPLINIRNTDCHTEQSNRPDFILIDWLYISLLTIFATIVVTSTTYDLVKHSITEKPDPEDSKYLLLTSFSLYTNGKTLINTRKTNETISCLDSLRFLSICWIIYGHTYYLQIAGVQLDLTDVPKMHEIWTNFFILNGNIVTDTFFLLSGILLTYSELGRKQQQCRENSFNVGLLYLHRYLRLTPAYAVIIGFYSTLFYKIGNGPQWYTWVGINRDYCVNNWWTNLLYINNYVQVSKMCMSQSWYLSVDMQLVWLSPIFLYPILLLGIKHIISIIILIVGLAISILTPMIITYINGLTATMLYYKEESDVAKVFLQIYTKVYARAGPYIVGLILGCILRHFRNNHIKISRKIVICGWLFSIITGCAVIFGPRRMYFADYKYNSIEAAFYAGFHRTAFALSVGWIVFASVFNIAGPIGAFLSWSGWMPLGKLTYSAYLTHYIVLLYNAGIVRTPGNLTTYGTVHTFLGNLGLTIFISTILCLCFEIPFTRIDYIITRGKLWHKLFPARSYKPKNNNFGSGELTNEIYKSYDDISSTVSQSSDKIFGIYINNNSTEYNIYHSSEKKSKLHTREPNVNEYF